MKTFYSHSVSEINGIQFSLNMSYSYSLQLTQYYTCSINSSNVSQVGPIISNTEATVLIQTPTAEEIQEVLEIINIDITTLVAETVN